MKIFCLLLLVAVAMEKCNGNGCGMKYLLVEIEDKKGIFYVAVIALVGQRYEIFD